MRPERVEHRRGKGLVLVHRCEVCGFVRPNRIADDPVQGDDIDAIIALMSKAGSGATPPTVWGQPRIAAGYQPYRARSRPIQGRTIRAAILGRAPRQVMQVPHGSQQEREAGRGVQGSGHP